MDRIEKGARQAPRPLGDSAPPWDVVSTLGVLGSVRQEVLRCGNKKWSLGPGGSSTIVCSRCKIASSSALGGRSACDHSS